MKIFYPVIIALIGFLITTVQATDLSTQLSEKKMTIPAEKRLQTLDVLGLGLSIEHFRQSTALRKMDEAGDKSIVPQDQKFYYWDATYRGLISRQREADSIEHCVRYFTAGWVIPNVYVMPTRRIETRTRPGNDDYDWIGTIFQPAGLHGHQTKQIRKPIYSDLPESVLESAFQFFEYHPEVPVLLIAVRDWNGTPEGYHKQGDPTESIASILLARRDRIEAMRPYVRASKGPNAYNEVNPKGKPPFKPSEFMPETWLDWQIKQFDDLPTIGILHRPVTVTYMKDKDGHPTLEPKLKKTLMSDHDKQLAFQAGWKTALGVLPEGQKQARIFYDHGDASHGKAVVPLSLNLHLNDPHFDMFDPKNGYNIHRRLGETGAASPFVMWNLGLIASYRNKNPSVAVNLRDPNQATITVISPGNDKRKHPAGDPIDFGLAPVLSDIPTVPEPAILANVEPASVAATPGQPLPDNFDPDATIPLEMAIPALSAMAPAVPLGTTLNTGQTCPQSGIWRCTPADARYGADHPLRQGQALPYIQIQQNRSLLQKVAGAPELVQVGASWTLIAHDAAQGEN
jgi:hypothetical protein